MPTVADSSDRVLTAMACELDLDLCHFRIEQAFVQPDLEENVLTRLPQGCGRESGKIAGLNKSLHGLKQASRPWHGHPTRCLWELRFTQGLADACVFRLKDEGNAVMTMVVSHFDDIFAVAEKTTVGANHLVDT